MKKRTFAVQFLSSWLLAAALAQASLPPLSALPPEPEQELSRLLEISTRLTALNEQLRRELEDSRKNSAELQRMLETSKAELEALKSEFSPFQTHSTELLQAARNSERELSGLRTALRQAESSLMSLEGSWAAYRSETSQQLAASKRRTRFYQYGFIAGLILSLAGWTAFAVTR
jgi:chromosome segregation ATPase